MDRSWTHARIDLSTLKHCKNRPFFAVLDRMDRLDGKIPIYLLFLFLESFSRIILSNVSKRL